VTDDLKPCPFCGGGETDIRESRLAPRMNGPGAVIAVEVAHWCNRPPGVVAAHFSIRARTREDAVAAWNRRTP
jgi:hypothetical protein